jgi:hypothetical protein
MKNMEETQVFHIFHIISQFSSVFSKSFHYSSYLSSIFFKSFHYFPNLITIQLGFLPYFSYDLENTEENCEMIWKIWKKIVIRYGQIWKKDKLKGEKIWKILKKDKLNSE